MLEAFAESSRVKLWVFNSVSWGRLGYSWHCNLPVHVLHIIAFARFIKIYPLRLSSHQEHTRDFDLDRRTPGSPGDETQLLTPGMNSCCRVGLGKKKKCCRETPRKGLCEMHRGLIRHGRRWHAEGWCPHLKRDLPKPRGIDQKGPKSWPISFHHAAQC